MHPSFAPHGGFHSGPGLFLALPALFSVMALIGLLLFLVWAVKHLPSDKLVHLAAWLFGAGVVGMVMIIGLRGFAMHEGLMRGGDRGSMMRGYQDFDDWSADDPQMMQGANWNLGSDMMMQRGWNGGPGMIGGPAWNTEYPYDSNGEEVSSDESSSDASSVVDSSSSVSSMSSVSSSSVASSVKSAAKKK